MRFFDESDPFEDMRRYGPKAVQYLMDYESPKGVIVRDALHVMVGRPRLASRTVFRVFLSEFKDILLYLMDRPRSALARRFLAELIEAMKRAIKRM